MVLTTLDSGVVRALWFDVGVVVTFCSFLLLWNHGVDDKVIVNFVNSVTDGSTDVGKAVQNIAAGLPGIKLPLSPFTLSSSSLGLLLVFRTNGAFQRFFEARVLWGAVVNYCRTMTRQGLYYLDDPKDIEELTRRTIAYCRAVKFHFRYDADKEMLAKKEFTELLGKEEAEKLLSATHRPCQAMADMTTFIRSCKLVGDYIISLCLICR